MRTDERSDAPLRSFSLRGAKDHGATLSSVVGLLGCGVACGACLVLLYVRGLGLAGHVISGALLLLSAALGLYAVLFAIGALSDGTHHRARALAGLVAGSLPFLYVVWIVVH